MQERMISMEDAFQVWWFIMWRAIVTLIVVSLALGFLINIAGLQKSVGPLANILTLIISILVQVFFFKSAMNRNYKNFRLSAVASTGQQ